MSEAITRKKDSVEILISFLRRTREGKYAQIDETSLPYSRISEERETVASLEEEFYYSIS
jgi:hypothetical protein